VAGKNEKSLTQSIGSTDVVQRLARLPFRGKIYLVGGAIRELALGAAPKDYDFALSDPDDLRLIEKEFSRRAFVLGKKPIQTCRIVADETILDITFLETSIGKDLERRDFTINAVAFDIAGESIIDPLGGLYDINRRIIRYPNPETIPHDPLRMLKAIRHYATLDDFSIDPVLIEAITLSRPLIGKTAPERIKYELDLILSSHNVHRGIVMLAKTGLIFEIVPELKALHEMDVEKNFVLETYGHTLLGFSFLYSRGHAYVPDRESLRNVGWALLFHDLGKADTYSFDNQKQAVHFFNHERISRRIAMGIMDRLRFSTHEIRRITTLIEHHMRIFLISSSDATEKAIRRLIYKMGDLTPSLIALTLCDMYGSSGGQENPSTIQVMQNCDAILAAYHESKKQPLPRLVSGNDLLSIGFIQGPFLGNCLEVIRDKQIAGEISTRDEAMELAREFVRTVQVKE
jgi:poly(A) polymerase